MKEKIYLITNTIFIILLFPLYNYLAIKFDSFYASLTIAIILGFITTTFIISDIGKSHLNFAKVSFAEIRLIKWQKKEETFLLMIKIFFICLILGILVFIMDNVISNFIGKILF